MAQITETATVSLVLNGKQAREELDNLKKTRENATISALTANILRALENILCA